MGSGQAREERLGEREGLAVVTVQTGEGVDAVRLTMLWFTVGEAGAASESAPIGGAGICAELLGQNLRGKSAKFSWEWLTVAEPCLEVAGACLDHGGGAIAFAGE